LRKFVSLMLAMLMMLVTVAMVVGSEDSAAKESMEKNLSATEKVTEEVKEKAPGAAENETAKTEEKKQPGFEGVFAITGLLAVAYLVLGRKE
jgi:hypothetical protein